MSSLAPARSAPPASRLFARLRPDRPRAITLALLLLIGLAPPTYLAQTGGALTTGYTIQRLQAERNAWKARNQQLELELAKARSLAWIETEAVNRLGMERPTRPTVIRVDAPPPPAVGPRPWSGSRTSATPTAQAPAAAPATSWLEGLGASLAQLIAGR